MIKRIAQIIFLFLLALILAVLAAVFTLTATETGTRWLLEYGQRFEPRLQFQVRGGTLWEGVSLEDFRWQDGELKVAIPHFDSAWQPGCLLQGKFCFDTLRADRVDLTLPAASAEPPPTEAKKPIELPAVPLPFELRLDALQVEAFNLQQGENRQQVRNIELALHWQETRLEIRRLAAEHDQVSLTAQGHVQLEQNHPLDLSTELTLRHPQLPRPWPVRLQASQNLADLAVQLRARAPASLQLDAQLSPLNLDQPARVEARWQTLQWPLAGPPQISSRQGQLNLQGTPDDYTLTLETLLIPANQPRIQLQATAEGNLETLTIQRLLADLPDTAAQLTLAGTVPLQLQQPADLTLDWQALSWPLTGTPQVTSPSGTLKVQGLPERYALTLATGLTAPGGPALQLDAKARGNLDALRLQQLVAQQEDGRTTLQGRVNWRQGVRWQAQARLEQLDLYPFLPPEAVQHLQSPLRLSGHIDSQGLWQEGLQSLELALNRLEATQPELTAVLQGGVSYDPQQQWRIPQLTLTQGDNRLAISGSVSEQWGLAGKLALVDTRALPLPLSGKAQGSFLLSGALQEPDLKLDLTLDQLQWQNYRLQTSQLSAQIRQLGQQPSRLSLTATNARVGAQRISQLRLNLHGTQVDHRADLQLDGDPVTLQLALSGQWADGTWQAQLRETQISAWQERWQLADSAQLQLVPAQQQLTLQPHCWQQNNASLCLQQPLQATPQQGQVIVALQNYNLQSLQSWLPPELAWEGRLSTDVDLHWQAGQKPQLQVQANSQDGRLLLKPGQEQPNLPYPYRSLQLDAELTDAAAELRVRIDSDRLGQTDLQLALTPTAPYTIQQSRLRIEQVPLAPLQPLIPQLSTLKGEISADGQLKGSLRTPDFFGSVNLDGGQVTLRQGGLTVDAINIALNARGKRATLDGSFRGGEGEGTLEGRADWRDPAQWSAQVEVAGQALSWSYQPWVRIRVNPDLKLEASPERMRLTGEVNIPYARIKLRDLPKGAVRVSEDTVIVDAEKQQEKTAATQMVMNVQVKLGRDVRFQGQGARGRLTGSVRLLQQPPRPLEANGEIIIAEGRYRAYGQNLTIRDGVVLFAGPITQPAVDIEAVRQVGDVTAGLHITGRVQNPRIDLFSSPPLQQEEILAYIVLGRPLNPASEEEGRALSGAATAIGLVGGTQLAKDLTEQLGIEDFEVTTEQGEDDTRLTFGGRIGSRLYLKYGFGSLTPVNKLTVRYYLTEKIYLEAVSALESALDIFYEFSF